MILRRKIASTFLNDSSGFNAAINELNAHVSRRARAVISCLNN